MAAPGAHPYMPYPYMPAQMAPLPFPPAPVHHHQPYPYAMHPGMVMYGQHPAMAMHQLPPHPVTIPPHSSNSKQPPSWNHSVAESTAASKRKNEGAKTVGAKSTTTEGEGDCGHNHWDSVRVKKGIATLCCRFCNAKWKLPQSVDNKCPDFYRGFCPFGPHCPFLHIHRFNSKTKSPDPPNYGGGIVKDCDFAAVARSILTEEHGKKRPTDVYEEVIVAYALQQQQQRDGGASAIVAQQRRVPAGAAQNVGAPDAESLDDDFGLALQTVPKTTVTPSTVPAAVQARKKPILCSE